MVVLWDLKCKKADYRYNYDEVRPNFPLFQLARLVNLFGFSRVLSLGGSPVTRHFLLNLLQFHPQAFLFLAASVAM